MPQHKSAEKRVRQTEKRRLRNRFQKARMRTLLKDLRQTAEKEAAQTKLNEVKALLDRLASKGIIHRNQAANTKSQLERHVNGL